MNSESRQILSDARCSVRALLENAWLERKRLRSDFSLRKFAEFLQMDPTALSRLLKGQREPTRETFEKIADRIGLSPQERQVYARSVKGQRGRPRKVHAQMQLRRLEDPDYNSLDQERFEAFSNWYYFAIVEVARLDEFQPDASWIAQRLNISATEVHIAVEKLKRLGFLKITENGGWETVGERFTSIPQKGITSVARRLRQKQLLSKASETLDLVPIEQRDQSSITFAVDTDKLDAARELIKRFRRDVHQLMQDSTRRNQVYHLSLSLFPLTN